MSARKETTGSRSGSDLRDLKYFLNTVWPDPLSSQVEQLSSTRPCHDVQCSISTSERVT